jgi:hypothetical protein
MAKKNVSKADTHQITEVLRVTEGSLEACLVGTSGIVLNRMSNKGLHELLFPGGPRNGLKHDPLLEFRGAAYTLADPSAPTLLAHLATAFKGALRNAALDVPQMKKAQIGRLTYVCDELVPLYGLPKLIMMVVRSADINRTPDVRTRVIIPEWACRIRITFAQQLIKPQAVVNLLATAGITQGVGDGRPEKGALSFGRFRLTDKDDPAYKRIVQTGGRKVQMAQMTADPPAFYDAESAELYGWFVEERKRREQAGMIDKTKGAIVGGGGNESDPLPMVPPYRVSGSKALGGQRPIGGNGAV